MRVETLSRAAKYSEYPLKTVDRTWTNEKQVSLHQKRIQGWAMTRVDLEWVRMKGVGQVVYLDEKRRDEMRWRENVRVM